ncbi:DUF6541 family protein [Agromyces marinus]|uniref:DUF6541 family protein n=1 Tax=Agromyces marinus TaxID=1389020 RepID=UPI0025747306|nr:DUF6541 family protein [Agromyces marinus]
MERARPLVLSLAIAAIAIPFRRWLLARRAGPGRDEWGRPFSVQALAIGLGAALTLIHLTSGMGAPDHPSQSYDTIFHLNAVQWVIDTGNASPFEMTMTTPERSSNFYPTPWHAIVAIVVQLSGASITVATNATMLAVASLVWTVSCVFFARVLFGRSSLHTLLAGGFSATFGAFPAMLTWFGVLYPNLLAVSLLPIPLALLTAVVQRRPAFGLRVWTLIAVALASIGATALAHPNALFSLFVLGAPLLVVEIIGRVRRARPDRRARTAVAAIGAGVLVFAAIVYAFSRATTRDNAWLPTRNFPSAMREAITNTPIDLTAAWVVTVMVLVGAGIAILRPRLRWVVASWLLAALLYSIAIAWPVGPFRTAITGVWYNDSYRLAVLTPILAVPLAVLGTVTVAKWVLRASRRIARGGERREPTGRRVAIVVSSVGILAVGLSFLSVLADSTRFVGYRYALGPNSPMLSDREIEFFGTIQDLVPEDAVVAGNPWNGSSLVYAYTGRRTVFPHTGGAYPESYRDLASGLADLTPEACRTALDLGVTHILDFGDRFVFQNDDRAQTYEGLTNVQESDGIRRVAGAGDLALFEVDCT